MTNVRRILSRHGFTLTSLALLLIALVLCTCTEPTDPVTSESVLPAAESEMEFIEVSPGEFRMGSHDLEDDEKPVRTVTISRGFQLGKYEVTQEQWEAVMGSNPSRFKGAKRPVEKVSWKDVQEFIGKMNQRNDGFLYRLTTEAEWEYAARAGTTGDYAGDLDKMGWYTENSGDQSHEVGLKKANAWGFHDMHGNVWEWVQDWYGEDHYASRPNPDEDPPGPVSGVHRVMRAGGWCTVAGDCRSAIRGWWLPGERDDDLGFRLLRQAE